MIISYSSTSCARAFISWQYGDLWHWTELQYSEDKHGKLRKQITKKLVEIMKEKYGE
ncbi:hypothetical protein [Halalkalibacter sp. APA_J-10(15)]|uniref:hypothetical protein n=1 Tax=Halalkalibacter sp. APA_J-10(15) TaxID=2933805 RepID=UPI001FF6DAE7|nr:hypothetical protein [Halalkalibacter sp. APA_J-10(15)]MCK0473660.1 hypothetical protein [Halalkalibacter sp. APA_J-10(15)]